MAFGQIGSVRSRFCLLSGKFLGAAEGEELPLMAIFWADYNIDSGGWHIFNECVAANNGTNLHLSPPNRIPIPKQNVLQLLPRPLLGKPLGQCVPMPKFHPPKHLCWTRVNLRSSLWLAFVTKPANNGNEWGFGLLNCGGAFPVTPWQFPDILLLPMKSNSIRH